MPGRRKVETPVALEELERSESSALQSEGPPPEESQLAAPLADPEETSDEAPILFEDYLVELMARVQEARAQIQTARERVRTINEELIDHPNVETGSLREKYQKAVVDLSAATRELNLNRSVLLAALREWHRPTNARAKDR